MKWDHELKQLVRLEGVFLVSDSERRYVIDPPKNLEQHSNLLNLEQISQSAHNASTSRGFTKKTFNRISDFRSYLHFLMLIYDIFMLGGKYLG